MGIDRLEVVVLVLVGSVAFGCAASPPSPNDGDTGRGGGGAADDSGGGSGGETPDAGEPEGGADFGDGSGSGCSGAAQLVYVVDYQRKLHRFDPAALAFAEIGQLTCTDKSVFSMAVSRDAVAWVLTIDGTMVRYDIEAHACTPVPFASAQHGFYTFGMGFSSNSQGSSDETLFVGSASDLGLATIDTKSLVLTPVGAYDELHGRVELTGTGNGQLFGAFEGSPYVVAEIGKSSAQILSKAPQDAIVPPPGGSNFAFAFWGGDFWLFVGPGNGSTDVFHYQPANQTTAKVANAPFEVVGAGVSTCAPTSTPK